VTSSRAQPSRFGWLLAAIAVAVVIACSGGGGDAPSDGRYGLGVYVPAAWTPARQVTGHDVHVVKHQVACSACHRIGDGEMGPVERVRCTVCHAPEGRIEHARAQAKAELHDDRVSDCTLCHRFTDAAPLGAQETTANGGLLGQHVHKAGDCNHCHLVQQGNTPGVSVHASEPCLNCHKPHKEGLPKAGPCSDCHKDITTGHALTGKTPNEVCTTCHQKQHATAEEAVGSCLSCHQSHEPIVPKTALFSGGHVECVGCHRPHEFTKEKASDCRSCHEGVVMFGSPRIAPHQQCTSCHDPHDVKGSPDRACARCHADKQPNHPKLGLAGSCVGCHDPHPSGVQAQAHAKAQACSSCHQAAHKDQAFHAGIDCKSCHQPHDFVRPIADHRACEGCHATELSRTSHASGHQACEGCHRGLPHHPLLPQTGCDSCHAQESAAVLAGHAKCTGCHEPHDGSQATPCRTCHQQEHASAPAGHQTCTNCHQGHSGSQKAPCQSCHQPQAATPHGQISGGCQNCHRPHGPNGVASAPACTTCHVPAQLPGLHQRGKHADCARCHGGHGQPEGAHKAVCLTCHQDRKQHFPDTQSCSSCHLFNHAR
jgi:hypothetical protein